MTKKVTKIVVRSCQTRAIGTTDKRSVDVAMQRGMVTEQERQAWGISKTPGIRILGVEEIVRVA